MTDSSSSNSSLPPEGGGGESSVDHALLESLFYDEMMLMDSDSKLISSSLLSTLAADGSVQNQDYYQQQQPAVQLAPDLSAQFSAPSPPTTAAVDASTLAEKALLQDFGVPSFHTNPPSSIPNPLAVQQQTFASGAVAPTTSASSGAAALVPGSQVVPSPLAPAYAVNSERPTGVSTVAPSAAVSAPRPQMTAIPPFVGMTKSTITMRQQPQLLMMQPTYAAPHQPPVPPPGYAALMPHQQHSTAPMTAASVGSTTATSAPVYSATPAAPLGAPSVPLYSEHMTHSNPALAQQQYHHQHQMPQHQPIPMPPAPVVVATNTRANGVNHNHQQQHVDSEEEKRTKLVSQFATLASRLGINLPPQVLESLTGSTTTATSIKPAPTPSSSPHHEAPAPLHVPLDPATQPAVSAAVAKLVPPPPQSFTVIPQVQQLATTAEAAIAAVCSSTSSRKRTLDDNGTDEQQANGSSQGASGTSAEKQPAYSKRRKKPTLSDCEVKLQNLKAENAMLKRHLANVSTKSQLLDQDRISQAKQMREMLQKSTQEGASAADQKALEKKLNLTVQNFTEMYSDYGRRRHHELTFHLEQLQRLANPTNFTKMGLWTLGQQSKDSRNPLAGILQKELGITAQQGKKILDQREKIRTCCSNLKECIVLLGKLKGLCEQKTQIFHDRIEKCREILTPHQVVKLLIWIDDHSELLDKACPGWGSEQIIHAKKGAPEK